MLFGGRLGRMKEAEIEGLVEVAQKKRTYDVKVPCLCSLFSANQPKKPFPPERFRCRGAHRGWWNCSREVYIDESNVSLQLPGLH